MRMICPHCSRAITITTRDEIILRHLAQELPLPTDKHDLKAMPRTVEGMMRLLTIPRPTLYKDMVRLEAAGLVEELPLQLHIDGRKKGCSIYQLTQAGREVLA